MRKYSRTPQSASRGQPSGLSAAYLEADLDDEEAEEYGDGEGLTATERARAALARPRRIDEAAEARSLVYHCLAAALLARLPAGVPDATGVVLAALS